MSEEVYTYRTAAEYLGVSERTIWNLVDLGEIACFRVGRQVRITRDALLAFIQQQEGAVA